MILDVLIISWVLLGLGNCFQDRQVALTGGPLWILQDGHTAIQTFCSDHFTESHPQEVTGEQLIIANASVQLQILPSQTAMNKMHPYLSRMLTDGLTVKGLDTSGKE